MNLLATLFAITESGVWTIEEIQNWADRLVTRAERPSDWIVSLSRSVNHEVAQEVVLEEMRARGLELPDGFNEVLLGCVFLTNERGRSSWEAMVTQLVDLADAYPVARLDVESLHDLDIPGTPDFVSLMARLRELSEEAARACELLLREDLPRSVCEMLEA